jgi:hypothetical protein
LKAKGIIRARARIWGSLIKEGKKQKGKCSKKTQNTKMSECQKRPIKGGSL